MDDQLQSAAVSGKGLVDYGSSSDSSEDVSPVAKRCKLSPDHNLLGKLHDSNTTEPSIVQTRKRMPLPAAFARKSSDEGNDSLGDSSLHEGRVRSFPHERGNWASYVYIPVTADQEILELSQEIVEILKPIGEFHVMDSFHVSLSRTVVLRHHWIDSLVGSLRQAFVHNKRFSWDFYVPEIYCNDEQTRTFIGLKVTTCQKELKQIVKTVDRHLEEFRLPCYYQDPSFHISIAWALNDVKSSITEDLLDQLHETVSRHGVKYPLFGTVSVDSICCQTGNKVYQFPLSSS